MCMGIGARVRAGQGRWLTLSLLLLLVGVAAPGCNKKSVEKRPAAHHRFQAGLQEPPHAPAEAARKRGREFNTEAYDRIFENPFLRAVHNPLSTFSIDVDTASYSNVRRMLNEGRLPPADAVRIEEFINYFPYQYAAPVGEHPIALAAEVAACPWNLQHQLVGIGLPGKRFGAEEMPPRNLVFLVDIEAVMRSDTMGTGPVVMERGNFACRPGTSITMQ